MLVTSSDHSTGNVGVPTVRPDESALPSAVTDEKQLDWKSTASAAAKLLLRGVRDSADAFCPLKSVAGGLCFVLDNCEVWAASRIRYPMLTAASANEGKYTSNRIVGTPGPCPR